MDNKETRKSRDIKNQPLENRKLNSSTNLRGKKDKPLPWWVELLFVQIGLPDKLLVKFLKSKRRLTDLVKQEKRSIFIFIFILSALAYLYPVIKYTKSKLDCEKTSRNYIKVNKNLKKISNQELDMLATNFCNGGNEIYEIENIK